ncbi:hypothetical protein QBC43DRAFT_320063 [Cladorrhinum sp. PSN259]|nr:hypothetical protein QBC43DRAFT_320063 [Cladorrhinum sp. PSN259]
MQQVPIEVARLVLEDLSDVRDLGSTVLTCRAFLHAFYLQPSKISSKVLTNQIGRDVLPEAIATLELRTAATITPPQAVALSKLDRTVRKLAKMIVDEGGAFAKDDTRVRCALYRFQRFCNQFGQYPLKNETDLQLSKRMQAFCSSYSKAQIQELDRLQHSLLRMIMPAVNEMAYHDVVWGGYYDVHPVLRTRDAMWREICQWLLARGLEGLYRVAMTETYEERSKEFGGVVKKPQKIIFLAYALMIDRTQRDPEEPGLEGEGDEADFGESQWHGDFEPVIPVHDGNSGYSYDELVHSFKKRADLYDQGLRGWWSFMDESRLFPKIEVTEDGSQGEKPPANWT